MKIIVLCGKSASGKDTVQTELVKRGYEKLISSTTRPMRPGEKEGREYFFYTKEKFLSLLDAGKFIEHRTYNTLLNNVPDTWYYGLEKRELNPNKNYVTILDLKGLEEIKAFYGKENVLPIYLDATNELRKIRCMRRGDFNFTEWNRRLKEDSKDFSKAKLLASEVWKIHVDDSINPEMIADKIEENLTFAEQMTMEDEAQMTYEENSL